MYGGGPPRFVVHPDGVKLSSPGGATIVSFLDATTVPA
jgi:hypothetical protein